MDPPSIEELLPVALSLNFFRLRNNRGSRQETPRPSRKMSTPHTSLTAAADERKARLAKLRTLKRKQPGDEEAPEPERNAVSSFHPPPADDEDDSRHRRLRLSADDDEDGEQNQNEVSGEGPAPATTADTAVVEKDVARLYLSGRNYDVEAQGPRLGFDEAPTAALQLQGKQTLEEQAAEVAAAVRRQADEDAAQGAADRGVDLFKLQPKKPNWDLKRDLDRKLEILNVRTDNAIARIVRDRIAAAKKNKAAKEDGGAGTSRNGAEVDDGEALVTGLRVREREEEDEERREREEDEESE